MGAETRDWACEAIFFSGKISSSLNSFVFSTSPWKNKNRAETKNTKSKLISDKLTREIILKFRTFYKEIKIWNNIFKLHKKVYRNSENF